MNELINSKDGAVSFIEFNINQEAMAITVVKNDNGTYIGDRTFDDNGPVPAADSAAAAKTAAKAAILADAAKVDVKLDDQGKYEVTSS